MAEDYCKIAGISTAVPRQVFDNLKDTRSFPEIEVKKVSAMAGVYQRRIADKNTCCSDLCTAATRHLLNSLAWEAESVDALLFISQTPDYFLPQTSCIVHKKLKLKETCICLDLGLGCSGYPHGLWLASMMIQSGKCRRVLLLHGDTTSRYTHDQDRSVALLFGDAGSATAIEATDSPASGNWPYLMYTDSTGYDDMIIESGAFRDRFPQDKRKYYLKMNGANVFNFTIKRLPKLIFDTLEKAGITADAVDYYVFHQSNQFIMKHLAKKAGLPLERIPIVLKEYGNTGGCSIPLAMTEGELKRPSDRALKLMLLGYGVGLSWASALIDLTPEALLLHHEMGEALD